MKQGWSAGYTTTLYTLGVAFPLAVGAVSGARLTGFYQFLDVGARYNLRQHLHSEAKELSAAGGKVKNVRDTLEPYPCVYWESLNWSQLLMMLGCPQREWLDI